MLAFVGDKLRLTAWLTIRRGGWSYCHSHAGGRAMLASSSKKPGFDLRTVTAMQFFTVLDICLIVSDIFYLFILIN